MSELPDLDPGVFPRPIKALVTGDRDWTQSRPIEVALEGLLAVYRPRGLIVVEGHAPGADRFAHAWAEVAAAQGKPVGLRCYPANWTVLGKAAGPARNQTMIDERPDLVLAYHPDLGQSTGTVNMVGLAMDYGVPVWHTKILYPSTSGGLPYRIAKPPTTGDQA